jgi:hypothetical protein
LSSRSGFRASGPVLRTGPLARATAQQPTKMPCSAWVVMYKRIVTVFETYPPPPADPAKHGISAISTPHARARIRRRIRLSRTRSANVACPRATDTRSESDSLRYAVREVGGRRAADVLCGRW